MNSVLSIIGAVASIISIPLGFYFFIRSKEEKRDKVKRDIIKILLAQLNDSDLVSIFEIKSVINSKCREAKISIDSIRNSEILEDLIAEIIANPLLQQENKEKYITNLKLLSQRLLIKEVPKNDTVSKELLQEIDKEKLESELEKILQKIERQEKSESTSGIFAKTATIVTILGFLTALGSELFFNTNSFKRVIEENEFEFSIVIGIAVSILGLLMSYFVKKSSEADSDK